MAEMNHHPDANKHTSFNAATSFSMIFDDVNKSNRDKKGIDRSDAMCGDNKLARTPHANENIPAQLHMTKVLTSVATSPDSFCAFDGKNSAAMPRRRIDMAVRANCDVATHMIPNACSLIESSNTAQTKANSGAVAHAIKT